MNYQTQSILFTSRSTDTIFSRKVLSTVKNYIGRSTKKVDEFNSNFKSNLAIESIELSLKNELLNKRENEINHLKIVLEEQISSFKIKEEELENKYISRVEDLRDIVLGNTTNEDSSGIQDIKILVFGNSTINKEAIYNIFNQKFINAFGEPLNRKCIQADHLHYNDVKKSNLNRKIKKDTYDFIIVGQHPHSIKGKNSNHSYTRFIRDNELKAEVFEQYNMPLNKRAIEVYIDIAIEKWANEFDVI